MSVNRKKYGPQEKAKIALEALKGELTMNEITKKYGVHASQIHQLVLVFQKDNLNKNMVL